MRSERRLLRRRPARWLATLAGLGLLGALQSGVAQEARDTIKPTLHGKHWVAITGKPLAATAGALTFANGGNAVDAACAMLAAAATMWDTLSWGGETVALVYDPRAGKVRTIDALGVAPSGATPEFFHERGLHGPPDYGPLAATTPGTVGGLITMLSEFGTMSLEQVLGPAMQMAAGYPMEQTQALNIENSKELLVRWDASRRVLLPHYDPVHPQHWSAPYPGEIFKQPELLATLEKLVAAERDALARGQEPQRGAPGRVRPVLSRRHRPRDRRRDAGRGRAVHGRGPRPLEGLCRRARGHDVQGHRGLQADDLGAGPGAAADAEHPRERRSARRWATTARATSTRCIRP